MRNVGHLLTLAAFFWVACQSLDAEAAPLIADLRSGFDGTCNGTTFSSPSAQFSFNDTGKVMVVSGNSAGTQPAGAGAWNDAPLFTTVVAVSSASTVTLHDACASTMQGIKTARWDLGTDNTVALQNCLNGGVCSVPAGNYLMSGPPNGSHPYDSDVYPPANSRLACQSGAVFLFPHHDTYDGISRSFLNLRNVSGVTISGCTITGTNLHAAFTQGIEFNYPIVIVGAASTGNQITGNTIENGWSDGEIIIDNKINATDGIPYGNLVSGNTLSNCGLNGLTIVSGTGNTLQNNTLTDCNLDVEPNSASNGPVFGNLIRQNTLTRLNRPGASVALQGQAYSQDSYGEHWYVLFSSCAATACDEVNGATTGGDTIAVINNTFVNDIYLAPFCRSGYISQVWRNNKTKKSSGQTCALGSAGCSYVVGSCRQPRS